MSDFVAAAIQDHAAVMFSWVHCPFCHRAKSLLQSRTRDLKIYEIDQRPDGDAISAAIAKAYGHETVPAIFIKGRFVGGYSDIATLEKTGELRKMLS